MSWQVYVDTNLLGSGKVHKATIIGLKDGVWAKSNGYELSSEEQKVVINAFKDLGNTQAQGICLAGQKFFTLQCNQDHVYGKMGGIDHVCEMPLVEFNITLARVQPPIWEGESDRKATSVG